MDTFNANEARKAALAERRFSPRSNSFSKPSDATGSISITDEWIDHKEG